MASSCPDSYDTRLLRTLVLWLGLYFVAHVVIRVLASTALEMDEAEQVFLTQWLLFGYSPTPPANLQPPLYTWLQWGFFQIFGVSVLGLSLLKNALLFLTFFLVCVTGRFMTGNMRLGVLSALSLFLFPQIAWESQRDLTHSVLAVCLGAGTLLGALYVSKTRTLKSYMLFGVLLGLGAISKYTFLIFAGTLILGLLLTPDMRSMLLDRRILVTLGVSVLVTLPHILWWWSPAQTGSPFVNKYPSPGDTTPFEAMGAFLQGVLNFLILPCIVYGLFFSSGFFPNRWVRNANGKMRLLDYVLILVLVVFCVITLLLLYQTVNPRWLQPLLWFFPIAFFSHLPSEAVTERIWRWFLGGAVAIAAVILVASGTRVVGLSLIDQYTPFAQNAEHKFFRYPARSNYPFESIALEVRNHGFDHGVIITNNGTWAGNMRLQFPDSLVVVPSRMPVDIREDVVGRPILAIWDASKIDRIPPQVQRFLTERMDRNPNEEQVVYREIPYRYSTARVARFGFLIAGQ